MPSNDEHGRGSETTQRVTWEEFLTSSCPHEWIFRGMRNSAWPLKTSLERHLGGDALEVTPQHSVNWARQELVGLKYFQRRAQHLLADYPADRDWVEWLILMQHYGAPTRLLDWTFSPIVAAYFAFEHCQNADEEPAIYALNKQALNTWHQRHSPVQHNFLQAIEKGVSLSEPQAELPSEQWHELNEIMPSNLQQNEALERIMDMQIGGSLPQQHRGVLYEVVPDLVELEVAVPHLRPAEW